MLTILKDNELRVFQFQSPHVSEMDNTLYNFSNPLLFIGTWLKKQGMVLTSSCNPILNLSNWFVGENMFNTDKDLSVVMGKRNEGIWFDKGGRVLRLISDSFMDGNFTVLPLEESEWMNSSNTSLTTSIRHTGKFDTTDIVRQCNNLNHCLDEVVVYKIDFDELKEGLAKFYSNEMSKEDFCGMWDIQRYGHSLSTVELDIDQLKHFTFSNFNGW